MYKYLFASDGSLHLNVVGEVLTVVTNNVTRNLILAHEVLAVTALTVVTADFSSCLPDELGEMSGVFVETWVRGIVLRTLIVPGLDGIGDVGVSEGKVLTILTASVCHNTVHGVLLGIASHIRVPGERWGTMLSSVLIVGIETRLVLGGRSVVNWGWCWRWSGLNLNVGRINRSRCIVNRSLLGGSLLTRSCRWLDIDSYWSSGWDSPLGNIDSLCNGDVDDFSDDVTSVLNSAILNRSGNGSGCKNSERENDGTHLE